MKNKEKFERLCRYIWRDCPHKFIAVKVNSITTECECYRFAAPDKSELNGTICISEIGMIMLAKSLGYSSIIIKQRGKHGKFIIPVPEQIERDKLLDY